MKSTLSRLRRGAAGVALSALAVTGLSVAPAQAADQDTAAAEGRFLDLDDLLLGLDLNPVANLNGHYNGVPSSPGEGQAPVDLSVLSGVLDLQVGATLLPMQDLITLGAAKQYSKSTSAGVNIAASGLVEDSGAISTGSGNASENTTIDLSKLLGGSDLAGVNTGQGLLEELKVELKAVAARAESQPDGTVDSDYSVAGAVLTLKSKTIGDLVTNLTGAVSGLETSLTGTVNGLLAVVDGLLSTILTVTGTVVNPLLAPNVSADGGSFLGFTTSKTRVNVYLLQALEEFLATPLTSDNGAVTLNLAKGTVVVDLAKVVRDPSDPSAALGLNGFEKNHEVLDKTTVDAIIAGLQEIVDKLGGDLIDTLVTALEKTSISIKLTSNVVANVLMPSKPQPRGTLVTTLTINVLDNTPTVSYEGSDLKDKTGATYTPEIDEAGILALVNVLVGGTVKPILKQIVDATQKVLDDGLIDAAVEPLTTGLTTLLQPLLKVVQDIVSLQVNHQDDPGKFVDTRGPDADSFTVKAVQASVLPKASKPLLLLGLAGATVTTEPLVTTALAASPATPAAGDKVTLTATGYANGETVTFKQGTTTIGTATAGSDGTATLDTFRVPASANAGDKIDFTSTGATNTTPAEASVTVKAGPNIAVTPGQGPAGTEAAITGSGFTPAPAGTTIDVPITVGGQPAGTVKVDDTGKIVDGQSITIPAGLTGPVKVVADDANRVDPSADFTVTAATLVTDVTQVHAGEDVKLTATGFAPGEKVTFTVAGNATPLGEGTADASGNVTTAVSYTVPNGTASGTILTFTATGADSGASDDGTVTVLAGPTLNLSPAQGPAGSEVTLTGGGYTPNAEVTIKVPGAPDKKVTTTGTGELPADTVVTIPAGQASPLTITVDDPKRDEASAPFTVTVPALTATPGTVQAGRSVTLSASGFQPGETVTFAISGAPIGGPVVADASGNATATESYKVPSGTAPGQFGPFTATGGTSDAVASTQVTVTAGPALQPNPPIGPIGSVVTLTGTGFTPNADVTVTVQGSSPAQTITVHTTATGEFPAGTTIKVSDVQGPATGFTAVDPELGQVSVPFLLTQQDIAASKPQLAPGQQTQLSLSGFQPGESVEISDGTNVIATVPAAAPGAPLWLPTTYTVADDAAPGTVTFTAKGLVSGATDTTVVTILSGPTLVLTPNQGPEGSVVTLSGSGYSPDTEVTIKVPGAPDKKVTTTPSGDLPGNVQITVPDGAAGQLAVTVDDPDRADGKATFTVTTPEVTADKTQAKAGDTVQLSASGFQPGELVTFSIGGTQVGTPVTADASGSATATATYTVPAKTAAGTVLTFSAEGGTSGAADTVDVTVLAGPTLNLNPSTGPSGSTVVVTGGGYEPGSEITIKVPGGTDVVVTATPQGEIPAGTTVTIPGGQDDGAELGITANDGKHDDGSATFTVTSPTFTASTTTPTVGDQVTFTGSGFVPGETVTVVFPDGSSPTDAPTADANGGFTVTWTPTQAGSGQATAEGAASQTPLSVELTVSDRPVQDELTLTPSNATPAKDEVVTFTGTGATPNATITLTGPSGTPATVQANDQGEFSFTWTAGDPGVKTFTAKDGDREVTATVTVQDDPGTGSNPGANDISNKDKNASASAGASVQADGNRNAGSVAAAQAAAFADASSNTNASAAASAAADGDRNAGSVAAAQAAAVADVDDAASADASKDATSNANASSAAAAQAAATHQGDNDTNAAASVQGDNEGTANAAAAAQAAAIANSSTNASQNASADSNASASANASANADGNRNAGSVAAAQAAAYKDADSNSGKDAAATANANSAAAAAATSDASKDASTDSTSTSTSAAQAAATSTSDEKSTSDANATAAANANASKAASASSTTVANGSQNASQNASADSNASASASASANADGNKNAVAQAAAQAAAYSNSDQESDASAAASKDATAASQAAANEQASSEASADVTSAANAQAIAAAQSASEANASASTTSTANANAAAAAAANATGSEDASVNAASNADGNNESEGSKDADGNNESEASKDADGGKDGVNATANDNANAEAEAGSNSSADASSEAESNATADANATAEAESNATADANATAEAESNATADANATAEAESNATADANADGSADGVTNEPKSTVSFKSIVRGTGVVQVVTGTDFQPGETVNATVHSKPIKLKAAKADANGKVTFRFAVGATFELGDHSVKLVGAKSGAVKPENDTTAFKVLDGINVGGVGQERPVSSDANSTSAANGNGSANGGQGLVDTGASSSLLWLAGVALLLLAAGGVTLAIRQRRKA